MTEIFDVVLDQVLGALDLIYGNRWVAPFVVVPLMFIAAAWVRRRAVRATNLYLKAADQRVEVLRNALGSDHDPVAERRSFAENFVQVSAAMCQDGPGAHSLVLAWRQFQEALVDENATPVRNTARPTAFFNRMAPRQTDLTFASNIFVGAGLILTFVGLIVALDTAAQGMAGSDVNVAKQSLQELLVVAGAKFFTSVAGLGASIWLRFTEHGLSRKVRHETELICDLLERGLLYISPQGLAVEQLEVLREQRDQLKFFNTDVALQLSDRIGAQFNEVMAPVTASLNALNDNMTSVTQGIGAGAAKAIQEVSGEQLRGLSETLANLSGRLDAISQAVGSSSDDAARQIRLAGEDFRTAASDIRKAFDELTSKVDGMGTRLAEQGEAASIAQKEALTAIMAGIEEAQGRSTAMITQAVAALESAGAAAAGALQNRVREGLEEGVKASQETFRIAIEESGQALRETTGSLSKAVGEAAQQVERAGAGFAQSSERAVQTADAMRSITDNARGVATALGEAGQGFASAASPVAQAAQSVNQAAQQLAQTVAADRAADTAALSQMSALAEGVRATQEAAEQSWRDYRARFEAVDRALAAATDKLAETLGDSLTEFRKFAQETDREMASAVGRLGNTLTQIEEYAEALDEYVEEARGLREAAE